MFSTRLQRAYPSDLTDAQWDLLAPLIQTLPIICMNDERS